MKDPARDQQQPDAYQVGYCRPPVHTRFQKGQSGNPGGRPRGMTTERLKELALQEAYRPVTVRVGDETLTLPAIQAVLRAQIALAAKGNGPAQRALIAAVAAIEQEIAAKESEASSVPEVPQMSMLEAGRRIAFVLSQAVREKEAT